MNQNTLKLMSTMFSSPVSISASSGSCRLARADPLSPERKPISVRLMRVTLGRCTLSIGVGQ